MTGVDVRKLWVGGLIGGDGVVQILGRDIPYPVEEVQQQLDLIYFMMGVGCFNCPVVTVLRLKPELAVEQVLGDSNRTLVTAFCLGGVRLAQHNRQQELGCHVPQAITLEFKE